MHRQVGTYIPSKIERDYGRVVDLCRRAFCGSPVEANEADVQIRALVPQGIYRHYGGKRYFALGIERGRTRFGHERYFVHTVPLFKGMDQVVVHWLLVGEEKGERDGWFLPIRNESEQSERFKCERRVSLTGLVRKKA